MRHLFAWVLAATLGAAPGAYAAPPVEAEEIPVTPETISISDEGELGYAIRHFPSRLRLYTYDRDSKGVSACFGACAAAWPPIRAAPDAKPVGDWTLVPRNDGPPQWAYKGQPVYIRDHDRPQAPSGDGIDGEWRLIKNLPRSAESARR